MGSRASLGAEPHFPWSGSQLRSREQPWPTAGNALPGGCRGGGRSPERPSKVLEGSLASPRGERYFAALLHRSSATILLRLMRDVGAAISSATISGAVSSGAMSSGVMSSGAVSARPAGVQSQHARDGAAMQVLGVVWFGAELFEAELFEAQLLARSVASA